MVVIAIDRPNKKALTEALDIYRDSMRPFIIRNIKRIPGRKVEDAIGSALRDDQYNQFTQNLREGRSVADAIDIGDFPHIIKRHWRDVFRDAFAPGARPLDTMYAITKARNAASHPPEDDIDIEYTISRLTDIAKSLAEINESERSLAIENIKEALMPFKTPAHKFRQGGRDVYAFALDLETLDNLLPDRVDDRMVRDANRPLTPSHAKEIQAYLEDRPAWLLGTLLLGVSPDAVRFEPYNPDSNSESTVGELSILRDDAASMMMFDGQHRRRAIKDALEELSHNRAYSKKLSLLKKSSLPIMLYAEESIDALRQMFADAAQTRRIERNAVVRFDQRDSFNLAALWIAENSDLFAGRVEMERTSVNRSNPNIIAINQLAVALKTLEVGYRGRVSKNLNESYMLDLDDLYERCLDWADDFMPAARSEYNDLMAGEIDNSDIPQKRAETMAYNATVIRIFAGCYHEWLKSGSDWNPLATFLRDASLKPKSRKNGLLVDAGVVAPGGTSPVAQQRLVVQAIDYIVGKAMEEN